MNRQQRRHAARRARQAGPSRDPVQGALEAALRLHQAGDLAAAARAYHRLLARQPDQPDALHFLGTLYQQQGCGEEALPCLRRAAALRPRSADFHYVHGLALRDMGRLEEAAQAFDRAARLEPRRAEIHNELAGALIALGRPEAAAAACHAALALAPGFAAARSNLAVALMDLGEFGAAEAACRQVLAQQPDSAAAHYNLGTVLKERGTLDEAAAAFAAALARDPAFADAHANLSVALKDLDRLDDAVAHHAEAVRLAPAKPESLWMGAYALLALGRLTEGWAAYEHRLELPDRALLPTAAPRWQGEPLDGKTILVLAEQGIGDEIQFASCLPDLLARAGHGIIHCDPRLEALFARSFAEATVRGGARDDASWLAELAAPDCHVPLASLLGRFRPTIASFPAQGGYLRADPTARERWAECLAGLGPGLKVGISWRSLRAGGPARLRPARRLGPHPGAARGAVRQPAIRRARGRDRRGGA